jgi:hypothetical protein
MLESKHKLHVRFEADNTGQFVRAQEDPNGQNTMYFDPQVETEEIALEAVVKLWDIRSRREAAQGNPMMFGTPDLSRFDSEKRSCPK